jgi:hypothetical protein
LQKETKEYTRGWKDLPCLWTGINNIVKMYMLPNAIHRFSAILIKILVSFFTKKNPKIHMEAQKTLNIQSIPKKKEQW